MLDEKLLEQYYDLIGKEGVQEMYQTFADNIGGYLEQLQRLIKQRDEAETRRQAHKLKGACRSVGLRQLASQMELLEREQWRWQQADDIIAQWATELPMHQGELRSWLHVRGI